MDQRKGELEVVVTDKGSKRGQRLRVEELSSFEPCHEPTIKIALCEHFAHNLAMEVVGKMGLELLDVVGIKLVKE